MKNNMFVGIIFVVITAIFWDVLGAVISHSAQKKLNLGFIQGAGMIVLFFLALPAYFIAENSVPLPVLLTVPLCGVANYATFLLMNKAMQRGHNGLTWAMVQSAFILPFLMGILFFHQKCSKTMVAGIFILLLSMLLMGFYGKGGSRKENGKNYLWLLYTLGGFLAAGIGQCTANIPSYFLQENPNNLLTVFSRTGLSALGTFAAFLLHGMVNRKIYDGHNCLKSSLVMSLATLLVLFFTFFSLDILAANNAGTIAYPMLVGVSIVLFFLYNAIRLKEKLSFPALCGVVLCLTGIVVIAI